MDRRNAQVWVETVIYTLIGLGIIGILLGVAVPKINESKDKALIEQSISVLESINDKVYEIEGTKWNKRVIDLKISKGKLVLDGTNNDIYWIISSKHKFSEPGVEVPFGKSIVVLTTEDGDSWNVRLKMHYSVDLKVSGEDDIKEISSAETPYSLSLENTGNNSDGIIVIDMSVA